MTHLNEEQIGELLAASPREFVEDADLAALQAHTFECAECGAEIARMKESLALFREASAAYAEAHLKRVPASHPPARRVTMLQPAYWAAAAAAVFLAAFVPMQTAFRRPAQPPAQPPVAAVTQHAPAESDEALLESVNRELSESVPTPMEALADPTGSTASSSQNSTQRTN
jgi:anti-sigma factor RsiW